MNTYVLSSCAGMKSGCSLFCYIVLAACTRALLGLFAGGVGQEHTIQGGGPAIRPLASRLLMPCRRELRPHEFGEAIGFATTRATTRLLGPHSFRRHHAPERIDGLRPRRLVEYRRPSAPAWLWRNRGDPTGSGELHGSIGSDGRTDGFGAMSAGDPVRSGDAQSCRMGDQRGCPRLAASGCTTSFED